MSTTLTAPLEVLEVEHRRRLDLIAAEHRQRMEYARIEHELRMESIEAEAALIDEKCRRLAQEIMPSHKRLQAIVGTFSAPPGTFDNEKRSY